MVKNTYEAQDADWGANDLCRPIIDHLGEAFFIIDLQGHFLDVNQAACEYLGYARHEMLALNLDDLRGQPFIDLMLKKLSYPMWEGRQYDLTVFVRQGGEEIPIELSSSSVEAIGRRVMLCSIRELKPNQAPVDEGELEEHARVHLAAMTAENRELQAARDQMEIILSGLADAIFALDGDGRLVYVNNQALDVLGLAADEVLQSQNIKTVLAKRGFLSENGDPVRLESLPYLVALRGVQPEITTVGLSKQGKMRWIGWEATPILGPHGAVQAVVNILHDITRRKEFEARLIHAALHDELTGLPNRSLMLDRLRQTVERSKRNPEGIYAVLFLDLDRFKVINDSLGHSLGDELLVKTARRLETCVRAVDTVSRLGGDEFVVLLEELHTREEALQIGKRILVEIENAFNLGGHEVHISTSIGVVYFSAGESDPEGILQDADIAMYNAKSKGRAQYAVFTPEMRASAQAALRLESELRKAFERNELDVFYEPIVSLEQREVIGFEALVRWHHPTRGLVHPGEFIPLAEETGLITQIDRFVMETACKQMMTWQSSISGLPKLKISVNMSSRHLGEKDFARNIAATLDEAGFDPHQLRLEITERVILDHTEAVADALEELRKIGVQVHVDDFGTGYSSLNYLYRLPIDAIKIDRTFIEGLGGPTNGVEIVQTILRLASDLGIEAIAEGVETLRSLNKLEKLGCELGQGFLFSKSLDAGQVGALLSDQTMFENGHLLLREDSDI